MRKSSRLLGGKTLAAGVVTFAWLGFSPSFAGAQEEEPQFTSEFRLEDCRFEPRGTNPYFILKPGYQLVLEGEDDEEEARLVITVLHETEKILLPGLGLVRTRVVEEREWVNDELREVSRNFLAICKETNDVFYFGEDVDIFNPDGSLSHDGAWRAGVNGAAPGIIMPGSFLLGARYFQEVAPGVAMDQGENVEMRVAVETEAGTFEKCVKVRETTPLEPGEEGEKIYCPGVGLTVDDELELVDFGFHVDDDDD